MPSRAASPSSGGGVSEVGAGGGVKKEPPAGEGAAALAVAVAVAGSSSAAAAAPASSSSVALARAKPKAAAAAAPGANTKEFQVKQTLALLKFASFKHPLVRNFRLHVDWLPRDGEVRGQFSAAIRRNMVKAEETRRRWEQEQTALKKKLKLQHATDPSATTATAVSAGQAPRAALGTPAAAAAPSVSAATMSVTGSAGAQPSGGIGDVEMQSAADAAAGGSNGTAKKQPSTPAKKSQVSPEERIRELEQRFSDLNHQKVLLFAQFKKVVFEETQKKRQEEALERARRQEEEERLERERVEREEQRRQELARQQELSNVRAPFSGGDQTPFRGGSSGGMPPSAGGGGYQRPPTFGPNSGHPAPHALPPAHQHRYHPPVAPVPRSSASSSLLPGEPGGAGGEMGEPLSGARVPTPFSASTPYGSQTFPDGEGSRDHLRSRGSFDSGGYERERDYERGGGPPRDRDRDAIPDARGPPRPFGGADDRFGRGDLHRAYSEGLPARDRGRDLQPLHPPHGGGSDGAGTPTGRVPASPGSPGGPGPRSRFDRPSFGGDRYSGRDDWRGVGRAPSGPDRGRPVSGEWDDGRGERDSRWVRGDTPRSFESSEPLSEGRGFRDAPGGWDRDSPRIRDREGPTSRDWDRERPGSGGPRDWGGPRDREFDRSGGDMRGSGGGGSGGFERGGRSDLPRDRDMRDAGPPSFRDDRSGPPRERPDFRQSGGDFRDDHFRDDHRRGGRGRGGRGGWRGNNQRFDNRDRVGGGARGFGRGRFRDDGSSPDGGDGHEMPSGPTRGSREFRGRFQRR